MDKNYAQYLLYKTRENYDLIAEPFSGTRQFIWEDLKPLAEYVKDGDKVLDVGCGNGRLLELFQGKNVDYIGVDSSEELIKIAKNKAKNKYPQAKFLAGDALNLPFANQSFDKVFSVAVLHHIPSEEMRLKFLSEASRVLKPQGRIILTTWYLLRKKKARTLLFKYTFLKLIGKSKLDFFDIFFPWKGRLKKPIGRYVHVFRKKEIKNLFRQAGLEVLKISVTTRGKENNLITIAQLNKI